jgi:hypothetical protein
LNCEFTFGLWLLFDINYWYMNYVWVSIDSFELICDLNKVCEINKIHVDFFVLLGFELMNDNSSWVDIVVKIAWLKCIFLCFSKHDFSLILINFQDFWNIILQLILSSSYFSILSYLIFIILIYTQDVFSVLNKSFFLPQKQ